MMARLVMVGLVIFLTGFSLDRASAAEAYCPPAADRNTEAFSQFNEDNKLRVGTKLFSPPFVIDDRGELKGLSISLWKLVAGCLGLSEDAYTFEDDFGNVEDLLEATADGKVHLSIAALSINAERETEVDFSHAYFVASLGALVADREDLHNFEVLIGRIFQSNVVNVMLGLLGFMCFVAMFYWYLERRSGNANFSEGPMNGLFRTVIWASLLVFQGRGNPLDLTSKFGQVTVLLLMFFGVSVISGFTAVITSSLTLQALEPEIRERSDLDEKTIMVMSPSAADKWTSDEKIFTNKVEAFSQVQSRFNSAKVDVFIHDRPTLRYIVENNMLQNVKVAPYKVAPQHYGIAFPEGSPLREPINRTLLRIVENDVWDNVLEDYLGK